MKRLTRLSAGVAVAAATAMALSGCGFHGLYSANLPGGANLGSHPYKVVVYFSDVLDLVPQSAVKVNDVAVGKVESIRLSRPGDDTGDAATTGWRACPGAAAIPWSRAAAISSSWTSRRR